MAPAITCECGACSTCKHREYMRAYYARNRQAVQKTARQSRARRIDKVRAYDRMRDKRDRVKRHQLKRKWEAANREKTRASHRRWAERNPEKRKAQSAVGHALRDGKLTRLPCEKCGDPRTHAHHDDYSKPLAVRWLCPPHHGEEHRRYADEMAA